MLPYTGVRVKVLDVDGKTLLGVEIDLPGSAPLVVIRGNNGFVMCGFLDISTPEKLGLVAARVRGVKSVEEMLEKEIETVTTQALKHGLKPGVRVREVLNLL